MSVLPEWTGQELSVDVLMPARSPQPAKVRLAVDALAAYLEEGTLRGRKTARTAGPRP